MYRKALFRHRNQTRKRTLDRLWLSGPGEFIPEPLDESGPDQGEFDARISAQRPRMSFLKPEPVNVDEIVRELAEIRIGTDTALVALYLNRRLRSQAIHDLNAVNHCT